MGDANEYVGHIKFAYMVTKESLQSVEKQIEKQDGSLLMPLGQVEVDKLEPDGSKSSHADIGSGWAEYSFKYRNKGTTIAFGKAYNELTLLPTRAGLAERVDADDGKHLPVFRMYAFVEAFDGFARSPVFELAEELKEDLTGARYDDPLAALNGLKARKGSVKQGVATEGN